MLSHAVAPRIPAARAPIAGRPAAASRIVELQRLAGNRAVAEALTVQRQPARPDVISGADRAAPKRETVYLGLNPAAGKEAARLKKASRQDVKVSLNDPTAEARFQNDPAILDFVINELGISAFDVARWTKAADTLLSADPHLRDQLADLMRWFQQAERGEITLERLVLSGHSNGVELWGDSPQDATSKPGTMLIARDIGNLVAAFPKAAAQVQDVMFSACFSINAVEIIIRLFPNLRTCWAYSGFSPDVAQGSGEHIAAFTEATEGSKTLHRSDKRGTSALWTKEKGYIVGDPSKAAFGLLLTDVMSGWRQNGEPMYKGERDVPKSILDELYAKTQRLLAHPALPPAGRPNVEKGRDWILRLRFWPIVRERFGKEYGAELQPIYAALGVAAPDWSKLTRVGLKQHLEAVGKAVAAHPDQAGSKATIDRLLDGGLFKLDPTIIRSDWI
jgi:hypothetical protein